MSTTECTACGHPARVVRGDYPFTESGLRNVVLVGIDRVRCDNCGNEDVIIPRLNELMRVLAFAIVSQPYPLQGDEIRFLRKHLNMTQTKFAELIDIHNTNLSKWENDEDKPGEQSDRLIRLVAVALGEGMKERIEEVVRAFPHMRERPRPSRMSLNTEDMSCEYA